MGALTALNKASPGVALPGMAPSVTNHRMGRPEEMPLNKIHPDPNNSRRAEDENTPDGIEEQRELTDDIKKRGVKSPISLRPHPTIADEYMINFGHRRFKGASDAGLATIPYFLDVAFDSYDQVKENLLHRKPSIWALAEFVQKKLNIEKQSKRQIAEGLGKTNQNLVTELVALANAPSCLHQAYANGVKSPRTLYDLSRAYEKFPEQVDTWCGSGAKITRDTIQDLLKELRHDEIAANDVTGQAGVSPGLRHDAKNGDSAVAPEQQPAGDKRQIDLVETPATTTAHQEPTPELRHDVRKATESNAPQTPLASTKNAQAARGIMVQYQGKPARIAPNTTVTIFIDGHDVPLEVPLSEVVFKGVK
jgi:ParB family chromosome partitioning protein